jgi:hypothetical protein
MRAKRRKIGVEQWKQENKRLFAKHDRAGKLMVRRGIKERTRRKWMNAYANYLHRIPSPEVVCHAEELI